MLERSIFCEIPSWTIIDQTVKSNIMTLINTKIGYKHVEKFPGCQPVSIEKKHIRLLQNDSYVVCDKTDGSRYLLVCLYYDMKPFCIMIERSLKMFLVDMEIHHDLYEGTVLDGELVKNRKNQYDFLVFDTFLFKGNKCVNNPFSLRKTYIETLGNLVKSSRFFDIYPKQMYPLKEYVSDTKYKTDGLVFTPLNKKVEFGTDYELFKWKPQYMNTVDFLIDSEYNMFLAKNGVLQKTNNVVKNVNGIKPIDKSIIVECEYLQNNRWGLVKVRPDKTLPNSIYVYQKTLLNIEENISKEDLFAFC